MTDDRRHGRVSSVRLGSQYWEIVGSLRHDAMLKAAALCAGTGAQVALTADQRWPVLTEVLRETACTLR